MPSHTTLRTIQEDSACDGPSTIAYPSAACPPSSIDLATPVEKAFLVAVDTGGDDGWTAEDSLAELANLATTAGADVVGAEWQNRRHVDPNWYVGKGKAEELVAAKRETGFDVLVADDELSPAQQRALEELLNVKVIDRSRLILDIFALHAQTHEGRLQVELAQLEYQLPRLTRLWTHLSRTGGGIGTRGPGESQLETDRRIIRTRISKMKERVEQVRQQRETAARGRDRRLWPTVGIVGYTNAGKSTLLNALVGSEVARAEDKLFATLDPTSRQVKLGDGQTAIVTDTVGFIHKLPHQLVDAFRATLEEVNRADVLVEVVDASDAHFDEHRATVQTVLDELGAGDKPRLLAFNKADLLDRAARDAATPAPAIAGRGLRVGPDRLRDGHPARRDRGLLASLWVDVDVALPYAAGELLARVRERGTVELEYGERDVRVTGRVAPALAGELVPWPTAGPPRSPRRPSGGSAVDTSAPPRRAPRPRQAPRQMTGPTRMAGWGRAADGSTVTWTVAEGSRAVAGARSSRSADAIVHALLLETDRDRRFSHLELARADGLLDVPPRAGRDAPRQPRAAATMAPSSTSGAGRSVPTTRCVVEGSPIALAALAWARATELAAGAAASVAAVVIGADGELSRQASLRVERLSATRWRVGDAPRWTSIRTGCRSSPAGRGSRSSGLDRRFVDGLWTTGPERREVRSETRG